GARLPRAPHRPLVACPPRARYERSRARHARHAARPRSRRGDRAASGRAGTRACRRRSRAGRARATRARGTGRPRPAAPRRRAATCPPTPPEPRAHLARLVPRLDVHDARSAAHRAVLGIGLLAPAARIDVELLRLPAKGTFDGGGLRSTSGFHGSSCTSPTEA